MLNVKFFIVWVVAFVIWFAGAYGINVFLIDYSPIQSLFRPWDEELNRYYAFVLADLMMSGLFVYFYLKSRGGGAWLGQGLRYGALAAMYTFIPAYLRNWVSQPIPYDLLIRQIIYFTILLMLVGAFVAFIYRQDNRT